MGSYLPLLELRPAVLTIVRVMRDRRREGELFTAGTTLPLHDPRDVVLVLVLPLALLAVVRDMLPGRIVEDRFTAGAAGFFQHLLFRLDFQVGHRFRFPGKEFLHPVEQIIPPQ